MLKKLRDAYDAVPEAIWVNIALAAIFLGAALAILGYLQPWVSCPDAETPAGCPSQAREIAVMVAGIVISVIGMISTAVLFGWHRRLFGPKN